MATEPQLVRDLAQISAILARNNIHRVTLTIPRGDFLALESHFRSKCSFEPKMPTRAPYRRSMTLSLACVIVLEED